MTTASQKGTTVSLLSAVTTGTGDAVSLPITSVHPRVNVRSSGTTSGGAISIEESSDPAYTGTWSVIQSVTASTISGGAELVIHIFGTINALRARISSNITGGGTISVDLISD